MVEKNKFFVEVEAVDVQLLRSSFDREAFSLRFRSENRIVIISLSGRMINLVSSEYGCGPDFIKCRRLPDFSQAIAEDGWALEDNCLKIPFLTQIKLTNCPRFDSVGKFSVRDFPGHMQGLVHNRIRQNDFSEFNSLSGRLKMLSTAIQQHETESAEEPILGVLGLGAEEVAAGDAALCGMLLTARCISLGRRLKINWFQRLSVEIRRMLHRAGPYGRNWLSYALDGRMTESQQRFFNAMSRDYESSGQIVVRKLSEDELFNGKAFMLGAGLTLDMVKAGLMNSGEKKSPGLPANRARR